MRFLTILAIAALSPLAGAYAQNDCLDSIVKLLQAGERLESKTVRLTTDSEPERLSEQIDFDVLESSLTPAAQQACKRGLLETSLKSKISDAVTAYQAVSKSEGEWWPVTMNYLQQTAGEMIIDEAFPEGLVVTVTPYWDAEARLAKLGFGSTCGDFDISIPAATDPA